MRHYFNLFCVVFLGFFISLKPAYANIPVWLPGVVQYIDNEIPLPEPELPFSTDDYIENGVLSWPAFADAGFIYTLEYQLVGDNSWQVLYQGENSYYQPESFLTTGTYNFRIDCSDIATCPASGYVEAATVIARKPDFVSVKLTESGTTVIDWPDTVETIGYVLEKKAAGTTSWLELPPSMSDANQNYSAALETFSALVYTNSTTTLDHFVDENDLFRVKACRWARCGNYQTSLNVEEFEPTRAPNIPSAPVARYDEGRLTVNWQPVFGATFFNVEISSDNGINWSLISASNPSNSYITTYLADGSYLLRINACNEFGCSEFSDTSAYVGSMVLMPPGNLSVELINGDLNVNWDAVVGATDYTLLLSIDNGLTWVHEYPLGNALSYQRTEVIDGSFVYKVKACNAYTCSNYTPTSAPVGTLALAIPSGLTATLFDGQLSVHWQGVEGATNYILRSESNGDIPFTEYELGNALQYLRSDVIDGSFILKVKACNDITCSNYSNYTSPVGTEVVAIPDNLEATSVEQQLSVTWDKVPSATRYDLQYLNSDNSLTELPLGDVNSYSQTELANGPYRFRVRACNQVTCSNYSAYSSPVGTEVLTIPSGLTAILFDKQLNVSWQAVDGATNYILQLENNIGELTDYDLANVLQYERNDVVDGAFIFRVKACNEITCSEFSPDSPAVGTLAISAPASISAAVSGQSMTVDWSDVENVSYQLRRSANNGESWQLLASDITNSEYVISDGLFGSFSFQVRACNPVTCSNYTTSSETVTNSKILNIQTELIGAKAQ